LLKKGVRGDAFLYYLLNGLLFFETNASPDSVKIPVSSVIDRQAPGKQFCLIKPFTMKNLIITCLIISLGAIHSLNASGETPLQPEFIRVRTGITLEYVEQGDPSGKTIIFLHGLSDSWHSFEALFNYLPSSLHAIAISQRGHGDSERPIKGYHPKDFASDIAAFIREKKTGPVIIAGHSMGGVVAQQFAMDYPQLCLALVIIDSDPAWYDNPGMDEFCKQASKLNVEIDRPFMDEFQRSTLAKPIDDRYFDLLVTEGLKVPARVFQAALHQMLTTDFREQLRQVSIPVLIFWGQQDLFCSRKDQEDFTRNLKNSQLLQYENTGHALHWEEPERCAGDLVKFINRLL
jgi:pimeloyl-ACP methyl ester carboxylesterase